MARFVVRCATLACNRPPSVNSLYALQCLPTTTCRCHLRFAIRMAISTPPQDRRVRPPVGAPSIARRRLVPPSPLSWPRHSLAGDAAPDRGRPGRMRGARWSPSAAPSAAVPARGVGAGSPRLARAPFDRGRSRPMSRAPHGVAFAGGRRRFTRGSALAVRRTGSACRPQRLATGVAPRSSGTLRRRACSPRRHHRSAGCSLPGCSVPPP